jgi:hypothetical protein
MGDPVPRWKQGGPPGAATAGRPAPGKRRKVLILSAVVLALAGAIAAWLLYPRAFQQPYFLALLLDQHDDRRLPANAWADADRTALRQVWTDGNSAFTSQTRPLLLGELDRLKDRSGDQPVVIYLSGCALPDAKGNVCLLVSESDPTRPDTWVPLAEVFARLKKCEAKNKLLLLDVMQPFTDARLGVLADEVSERVWPALEAAVDDDPGLRILTACGPGQVSLSSEELGHTAFAWYVLRGLRGEAEVKKDGRITLSELADFVGARVDRWAVLTHGRRQTPVLLGGDKGKDFALAALGPDAAAPKPGPQDEKYPDWLLSAWKERDKLWAEGRYRADAAAFRALEAELLRAEARWRAGAPPDRVREDLQRRTEQLTPRLKGDGDGQPAEPGSLAAAVARLPKPLPPVDTDTRTKLRKLALLDAQVKAAPKQPDPADVAKRDKEKADFLKDFADKKDPGDKKDAPDKKLELCWTVFGAAAAEEVPTRAHLDLLAGLLPKEAARYAETRLLKELLEKLPEKGPWPARAVHHALRAGQEAEIARLGEPEALRWVDAEMREAARLLREGKAALLASPAATEPEEMLRKAELAYRKANADLGVVQRARRARDRLQVRLAGCAGFLEEDEADEDSVADWEKAVDRVCRLRKLLARAPGKAGGAALKELETVTEELNDMDVLKRLEQLLDLKEFRAAIGRRSEVSPADARRVSPLLRMSWPDAAKRAELWKAHRELAGRLQGQFDDKERAGGAALESPALPDWGPTLRQRMTKLEARRALRRARLSQSLLRLEERPGWKELPPLRKAAADPKATSKDWKTLADKLRALWAPH